MMLAKLLKLDHGQQARPGEAARHRVERGWRLGHRLAVPAQNFSRTVWTTFHCRNDFQRLCRLRNVFAQL
ncbi:hypothetical protein [Bradyrhizobium sp. TM239]|uniref:hypothetical protein n=1 Tax=Bradyrhizobium sp. TM239 TaxID=2599802 RepID=UPI00403DEB10